MEIWQIASFAATVIFFSSLFFPLIGSPSYNLTDLYYYEFNKEISAWGGLPIELRGIYVTLFLYPLVLILAFLAPMRRKFILLPGIVGVICWVSSLVAITYFNTVYSDTSYHIEYGTGIFVGLVGASVFLLAYFLKSPQTAPKDSKASARFDSVQDSKERAGS